VYGEELVLLYRWICKEGGHSEQRKGVGTVVRKTALVIGTVLFFVTGEKYSCEI
jgi:hypothetical protein